MILPLAVFSGLALNLILQLGLGIGDITAVHRRSRRFSWFQWAALFLSVLILWVFFSRILIPLSLGFLEFFLLFPCTALVCAGLERGAARIFPKLIPDPAMFTPVSSYGGLALTALMLTLRLAASLIEAAVLSLGFTLGSLLSALILNEIHRRASMEAVPPFLRGAPLTLISMGILSLVFSFAAALFLTALN
jgi:electron transport complex protein RnfA